MLPVGCGSISGIRRIRRIWRPLGITLETRREITGASFRASARGARSTAAPTSGDVPVGRAPAGGRPTHRSTAPARGTGGYVLRCSYRRAAWHRAPSTGAPARRRPRRRVPRTTPRSRPGGTVPHGRPRRFRHERTDLEMFRQIRRRHGFPQISFVTTSQPGAKGSASTSYPYPKDLSDLANTNEAFIGRRDTVFMYCVPDHLNDLGRLAAAPELLQCPVPATPVTSLAGRSASAPCRRGPCLHP
jgi:hypothetical protein